MSYGRFTDLLRELNETPSWRRLYGPVNDRMKDQELLLRFLALATSHDVYKRPLRRFLDRFLDDHAHIQKKKADEFRQLFVKTIDYAESVLGQNAFRPEKQLNAAVFDAVMVALWELLRSGKRPEAARLQEAFRVLLENPCFRSAYLRSTADEEQVRKRIEIAVRSLGSA